MSAASARAELAAVQTALVRALLADGPVPEGFDPARVTAAARALRAKRDRLQERRPPSV